MMARRVAALLMLGMPFVPFMLGTALMGLAAPAQAFPGVYVARHAQRMTNRSTTVVLVRDGRRTVVTIQPDYRGPAEDFALVLPVAGEVRAEDVKTLDKRLLERVDRFSAPRLLEVWEQDPCAARPRPPTASAGRCEAATNDPRRPEPVQTFQDGEYSFMAPGPAESATIVAFLRARDYQVSDAVEAALLPHMAAGARFLIAEVDRRQVHFSADGEAVLSPLRFHYDGDRLALPLQIGTVNASGPQELVIHVLAARRHEPANAPSAIVPTAIDLRVAARERFGPVYAALFDAAQARQPNGLLVEFAGPAGESTPCAISKLGDEELGALGLELAPTLADAPPSSLVISRLHARWSPGAVPNELELRAADPIAGGIARTHATDAPEPVMPAANAFQARYLIRHAWPGAPRCEAPVHGVWGEPADGEAPAPRLVRGNADVERDLALADYLAQDLPELGVKARRCGCDQGAPAGAWLTLVALLGWPRRRRR